MTSNLGTDVLSSKRIGFSGDQTDRYDEVREQAVKNLKPEFVNRIDQIVVFNQLTVKDYKAIAALQFKVFAARVKDNYKIGITYTDEVVDFIVSSDDNKKYGAREIKREFRKHIENNLAELLVNNKVGKRDIEVYLDDGIIKFKEL
jgi:ATP-dependent Clp protease ATP-binding subunit ClpB